MAAAISTRVPLIPAPQPVFGANQVILSPNQQPFQDSGSADNPPGPGDSAGREGKGGGGGGDPRKRSTQAVDDIQAPTPPVGEPGAANNLAVEGGTGTDKGIASSNNEVDNEEEEEEEEKEEEEYLLGRPKIIKAVSKRYK